MEILRFQFIAMAVSAIVLTWGGLPSIHAQSLAPAPAPSSDGVAIDQGIAYVLMVLALLLTYMIH
ncbi:arabinogalactan protein 41-like [Juglans regia]|uniref:Arabinogalactan protein 41-like n=1 Tax=Juglans regia TaxID=51240 RepID=A0A2I4GNA7_JUGRE|nr:arabinogalactan protein 41-like [Juglans regia]